MKNICVIALLCVSISHGADAMVLKGGASNVNNTIGGASIGQAGSSGIYSGYTMSGGDNFYAGNLSNSIVHITNPLGRYFPTIAYEAGARGTTGELGDQYDSDPFNTGDQDANQGTALGSTTLNESPFLFTFQARIENSAETGKIGSGRTLVTSMIHTGGYMTFSPPAIVEAYVKFSTGTIPSGWHPTFWLQNSNALNAGSTPKLEFDMEADTYDGSAPNGLHNNVNNYSTSGWSTSEGNGTAENIFDNQWHLLSMILTSSSVQYYLDGVLHASVAGDTTAPQKPYYIFFTDHIINPTSLSDWTTAGSTGVQFQVAWYRVWIPIAQYPSEVIAAAENLPTLQVNYNTSMTYTIPSTTALWGSAITDFCQGIKFEDYEAGSNVNFAGNYIQWPAGLTWNVTTRQLTGVTSDMQPGRIHTACTPAYVSGGSVGYVARGYIDIGPTITSTTISYSNSTGNYSVYGLGNCGTLLPKTMSVTGLPSGLSFSASTFTISGTATPGAYPIVLGVTNSSGQNATQNVTLTVGS